MNSPVTSTTLRIALLFAWLGQACSSNGISSNGGGSDDELVLLLLTTSGAAALGTTGGGVTTTEGAEKQAAPSLWVGNRRQIQIDIARGRGDWINDLASELALPDGLIPHLGQALKRNREVLSSKLVRDPIPVRDWELTLGDALCCDPWIHPFALTRFKCRAPGEGAPECTL